MKKRKSKYYASSAKQCILRRRALKLLSVSSWEWLRTRNSRCTICPRRNVEKAKGAPNGNLLWKVASLPGRAEALPPVYALDVAMCPIYADVMHTYICSDAKRSHDTKSTADCDLRKQKRDNNLALAWPENGAGRSATRNYVKINSNSVGAYGIVF